MAVINFCVRPFLPGPLCCFRANVPFSFKVSKPPAFAIFDSFWLQGTPHWYSDPDSIYEPCSADPRPILPIKKA